MLNKIFINSIFKFIYHLLQPLTCSLVVTYNIQRPSYLFLTTYMEQLFLSLVMVSLCPDLTTHNPCIIFEYGRIKAHEVP